VRPVFWTAKSRASGQAGRGRSEDLEYDNETLNLKERDLRLAAPSPTGARRNQDGVGRRLLQSTWPMARPSHKIVPEGRPLCPTRHEADHIGIEDGALAHGVLVGME
jgi:hypothetical protein